MAATAALRVRILLQNGLGPACRCGPEKGGCAWHNALYCTAGSAQHNLLLALASVASHWGSHPTQLYPAVVSWSCCRSMQHNPILLLVVAVVDEGRVSLPVTELNCAQPNLCHTAWMHPTQLRLVVSDVLKGLWWCQPVSRRATKL